jgi:mono/diheme cytochrome c family protein
MKLLLKLAVLLSLPMAAQAADAPPADLVARGAYLANAGDCIACHTAKGGKPLAGGLYMNTPFGAISTPNITPDKATGIGAWSDEQFYRAVHEGIGHQGEYLYPVMPFPWYTIVTREDVMAIRAYLNAQPAVHQARPPNKLRFPYSIRESLLGWRQVFFKPQGFTPDPKQTDEVNRGAYLVNGLAHCGECHNSRPVAGTSKWREALQGGVIDNWYAPNITSDMRVEQHRHRHLPENRHRPGQGRGARTDGRNSAQPEPPDRCRPAGDRRLPQDHAAEIDRPGPEKAAVRRPGRARRGHLPQLLRLLPRCGRQRAQGRDPGAVRQRLQASERNAPMLAIGAGMTDAEVADVANYVRQTWDNAAPPTAMPGMVAQLRAAIDTPMNGSPKSNCPAVASPALAQALASDRGGLKTQLASVTEANMPQLTGQLVSKARAAAPGTGQADLVNGLTSAYCAVVRADPSLDWNQRALRLGHFSEMAYMTASGHSVR